MEVPCVCTQSGKFVVQCPYCGDFHTHGAEDGAFVGDVGVRVSHCHKNKRIYYLRSVRLVSDTKAAKKVLKFQ